METIAVFVNDAVHARRILQPMLRSAGPTRWIVVACAPVLTRHIGRWVTQAARRQWRERWAADLYALLEPELRARAASTVELVLAQRPLLEVSARLRGQTPGLRLLDARQARAGRIDEPISADQPVETTSVFGAPAAVAAGLSVVLTLAD